MYSFLLQSTVVLLLLLSIIGALGLALQRPVDNGVRSKGSVTAGASLNSLTGRSTNRKLKSKKYGQSKKTMKKIVTTGKRK